MLSNWVEQLSNLLVFLLVLTVVTDSLFEQKQKLSLSCRILPPQPVTINRR